METQQEAFKFLINKIQATLPVNLHINQTFPLPAPEVASMVTAIINQYKEQDVFLPEAFKTVLQQLQFNVFGMHYSQTFQLVPQNVQTRVLTMNHLYEIQPEDIYKPIGSQGIIYDYLFPNRGHHQAIIKDLAHGL